MFSDQVEPEIDIAEGTLMEPVLVLSQLVSVGTNFVHDLLIVTELNVSDLGESLWENTVEEMGRLGYGIKIKRWQALRYCLVYGYLGGNLELYLRYRSSIVST